MYDRILIAVDGSEEAEHAARRGLELARVFDAAVDVLHVVEHTGLRLTQSTEEERRLREYGEAALAEIEELAAEAGETVTTTLTEGTPAVRIAEHAAERDAGLVVLGRRGLTGVGERLLGGVTERVLHHSDAPVLVVPDTPEEHGDCARVLVPTDGSENAEAAVEHGGALGRRYGAELHALNVVDLQAAGGVFGAGGLEQEFVERLEASGCDAVERVATGIAGADADPDARTAVERTDSFEGVGAGIREYVREADIDVVVMGSRGRSNLERGLLGSVTSTVLRTVDVPVLVVP